MFLHIVLSSVVGFATSFCPAASAHPPYARCSRLLRVQPKCVVSELFTLPPVSFAGAVAEIRYTRLALQRC